MFWKVPGKVPGDHCVDVEPSRVIKFYMCVSTVNSAALVQLHVVEVGLARFR